MTMPSKLTRASEKRVTEDWQSEVPSLGIYKPRHLLRRVGPLLLGICLDRESAGDVYKPCFHVHNLGRAFPVVSLTLATDLRSERSGGQDFVEVKWHEKKYHEACRRMVRQSLLPLEGDLHLDDVLNAYRTYLKTPFGRWEAPMLYRDMIILSASVGTTERAVAILDEALMILGDDEVKYRHVGGRAGFEEHCQKIIKDPETIQQTVDAQIEALGVGNLPVSDLLP